MAEPTLTRCASCSRAGIFTEMLYCAWCAGTFCRGPCHAEFFAGRWAPRTPGNDTTPHPEAAGPGVDE
jgi:hypothetical protein